VVEGIYEKTGELCALKEVVALCRSHKVRILLDETISFGVLGKQGKGITQFLNVPVTISNFKKKTF
jgi:serine palmitoyltransferase